MKNYKITVAYDGTRYSGWEKKEGRDTIQGKLESVLGKMCGQEVKVNGAGRTDAGVHAKAMTCSALISFPENAQEIKNYMNTYLPEDIAVKEVREASDRFHARYHAAGKTYVYTCYAGEEKPVFDRKYVYALKQKPDVEKMRQAAKYLVGQHDFKSFCGNPKMKKSTVRTVDKIEIGEKGDYLRLVFHGDGFLQHMVRILVGTLLEVGWEMRKPEEMQTLLEAKNRSLAGVTAPAQGLCLEKVDY